MYDSAKVSAMMKATIQKCFSESCRTVRGSKGLDHTTFGAAGEESEGDDLYIVIRDVMIYDNLGGTADNMIITPHICDEHIWGYLFCTNLQRKSRCTI